MLAMQLAQRVPELSAAAYGEKDVDFQNIDVWDTDVMDFLDSGDLENLTLEYEPIGDEADDFGLVKDEDIYEEVAW